MGTLRRINVGRDCLQPETDLTEADRREIRAHRKLERGLMPLRIDPRTVIYVTPDKCNERYAENYRQRLLRASRERDGGNPPGMNDSPKTRKR